MNQAVLQTAIQRAIERRRELEARDPVILARRAGLEPDGWQAALLRSDARQMIVLASRQSGKSTTTAALALHAAIHQAPALVLMLSPSLRQSGEIFRKTRDFLNLLPDAPPVASESALRLEFENGSRVVALPGQESTIRGYSGVSLLIVDEAARVDDGLYASVRPMLAVSQGKIVLLSTPFGKRGFFHDVWENGGQDWHRTKITAHSCPRIPKDWLEAERESIGDFWFRQEFECEFLDDLTSVFRFEDIQAAMDGSVKPLWEG